MNEQEPELVGAGLFLVEPEPDFKGCSGYVFCYTQAKLLFKSF